MWVPLKTARGITCVDFTRVFRVDARGEGSLLFFDDAVPEKLRSLAVLQGPAEIMAMMNGRRSVQPSSQPHEASHSEHGQHRYP